MKFLIDQSGKIENTSKDTVLCLSNGKWDAVELPSRVKRQIQEIFRRNGRIKNFIYFTFAAGIAILLLRNRKIHSVMIDKEYIGHEASITNIIQEIMNSKLTNKNIVWGHVGKNVGAHLRSLEIARGRSKGKKILTAKNIFEAIKKTEVGKRLKNT